MLIGVLLFLDRIGLFDGPVGTVWRRTRRLPRAAWGGAVAHAGMGVMILGLAGMGLATDKLALVKPGESARVEDMLLKALQTKPPARYSEGTLLRAMETGEVSVKTRTVNLDEGARPDTSLEGLAKLKPVFAAKGSVTAGNSSQTSDGAGALILASERAVKQFDLKPLARFVSFAVRGVPPEIMGIGPIEAIPAALRMACLKASDMDWVELNEAFAAQSLAVIQDLGLDPARVNVHGGAVALGHPIGASGAIFGVLLAYSLTWPDRTIMLIFPPIPLPARRKVLCSAK